MVPSRQLCVLLAATMVAGVSCQSQGGPEAAPASAPAVAPATAPGEGTPATAPAAGAAEAAPDARYLALTVNGNKIGFQEITRSVAGGRVTTVVRTEENARRGSAVMARRSVETAVETADGRPVSFRSEEATTDQPRRSLECLLRDGKAHLEVLTGDKADSAVVDWVEGVLMPEGERLLRKKMGFKEGTAYAYRKFAGHPARSPMVSVVVGPTAPVELIGRKERLTELAVKTTDAFGNESESAVYVDGEGNELKLVMRRVGATMATVACDKDHALGGNRVIDASDSVLPKCPPLEGVRTAKSVTFIIKPAAGKKLAMATLDHQAVATKADGTISVTVSRTDLAKGAAFPYKGDDAELLAATRPTAYLESGDKAVVALAQAAVGKTADAGEAVRNVEMLVRAYVRNADSVPYATAAQVAQLRRGDCTEYAVLTAAMLRSAGIPARVVVGVVYAAKANNQTDVLVPHAWVIARVGDKWVGVDAALGGFDAGRIALTVGDGDPESFAAVCTTIGNFTVQSAVVKP